MIGQAIDAYAHHVLADNQETLLLTDLQGEATHDKHFAPLNTQLVQGVVGPDKEVILFDPQAHSWVSFNSLYCVVNLMEIWHSLSKNTGFLDRGVPHMHEWQCRHKCKALGKKLGLKDIMTNIVEEE